MRYERFITRTVPLTMCVCLDIELSNSNMKKSLLFVKPQVIKFLSDDSTSQSLSHLFEQLFATGVIDLKRLEELRQIRASKQRADRLFHVLETSQHPLAFVEFRRLIAEDFNDSGNNRERQVSLPHPVDADAASSDAASRNDKPQRRTSTSSVVKRRHLANAQTQTDAVVDDVTRGRRLSSPKQPDLHQRPETIDEGKIIENEPCKDVQQTQDNTRISDEKVPSSRSESPKSTTIQAKSETAASPVEGIVYTNEH